MKDCDGRWATAWIDFVGSSSLTFTNTLHNIAINQADNEFQMKSESFLMKDEIFKKESESSIDGSESFTFTDTLHYIAINQRDIEFQIKVKVFKWKMKHLKKRAKVQLEDL